MLCGTVVRVISGLTLLAASPVPAAAEHYPPFEEAIRSSPAGLCLRPEVRKELALTDAQVATLPQALKPALEAYDAGVKALAGLEPAAARERHQKLAAEARVGATKAIDGVLTPAQAKRLRQIDMQERWPAVLLDPDVQKELGLTDAQKKKLGEVTADYERKSGRLKRGTSGGAAAKTIPGTDIPLAGQDPLTGVTPAMLRKEYALAMKTVLTPGQQTKWDELVGKPFPAK